MFLANILFVKEFPSFKEELFCTNHSLKLHDRNAHQAALRGIWLRFRTKHGSRSFQLESTVQAKSYLSKDIISIAKT